MKSFITYQLKNYMRSLFFIPPVALYFIWVFILYAYSSMNPLNSYANSAIVLYFIMTWITMNVFRIDEEAEKHILLVHLSQKEHYLYGKWLTCVVMMLPLLVIAHFYPIITNSFTEALTPIDHVLSFYCHIGLGGLGILVGSFFAGTSITKKRYVWLLTTLTVTLSFAHSRLTEILPSGFSLVLWILPPVRFFYEPLKESGLASLPPGFLAAFCLATFYMLIGSIIVLKMFMRNEKI